MLPPGEVRTGADVEAGEEAREEGLKPADIDAYWLQRNISKAYGNLDENEAVKKSEEVFGALQVCCVSASPTPLCSQRNSNTRLQMLCTATLQTRFKPDLS